MDSNFIHKNPQRNLTVSLWEGKEIFKRWHSHAEMELVYINNGKGILYIGDFIGDFKENDVFLIGKNVPHMFHNDMGKDKNETLVNAYAIHFNESFLINFSKQAEFGYLLNLIEISQKVIIFEDHNKDLLLKILNEMPHHSLPEKILDTLQILYQLSNCKSSVCLGESEGLIDYNVSDKRLNKVVEYTMLHFKEHIDLEKAAEISRMNKTAFCRYFKQHTGKSFVTFLNEIRIKYSCKLLMEINPGNSISAACYQSGFNSLTYYGRSFKKIMGVSPTNYRKNAKSSFYS